METILLVQRDPEVRRLWRAALDGLAGRVLTADSLLQVPKILARERISAIVAELAGDDAIGELRWIASVTELPALVLVTELECLPPLAARSRGAAVVPRGRPMSLRNAVEELLAARRQPAMNLPLRLPQVCETKWTARLRMSFSAGEQDTWPGDAAA